MRISTLPTIYGEKIVIRLLRKTSDLTSPEGIGLRDQNKERFLELLRDGTEGMILVVGPTGSGKTSTMYTMMEFLKSDEINLISLEDPVEYHMDDACQVQINDKTGLTFANALRAVLRQDPDIVAVGEIRDGETAEIAMRAAMTGHMVLSSVHTNSAVSSIDRLIDIGVEPYLVAGALRGIVSQRLVRRICPYCRKSYQPSQEELALMGFSQSQSTLFYRGEGCPECFNTGYRGRTGVFEILKMTPLIREAIYRHSAKGLEEAIKKSDFLPVMENCRQLVSEGITSVDEVVRMVGKE